jgi:methylthioribose-1-phosphate isomerase
VHLFGLQRDSAGIPPESSAIALHQTRNSSIPRVNALRTAKVRAPPGVYVAALKFGLVLALELDMNRSVREHIRRLEEQVQRLTESNMENKALTERNQIESEIRATTLALSH